MPTVMVEYRVPEGDQYRQFVKCGDTGPKKVGEKFDVADLTPEARAILAENHGLRDVYEVQVDESPVGPGIGQISDMIYQSELRWRFAQIVADVERAGGRGYRTLSVGELTETEGWVKAHPDVREHFPSLYAEYERQLIAHAKRVEREEEARARREEKARRDAAAEEEKKQQRQAAKEAKATWIAEHGSPHLCRAFSAGYDCQRLYVEERAAQEHPGVVVDFDDNAAWKDRSCPSPEALAEALELPNAWVVWLTAHPDPDHEIWFEECEAIVVRGYLGKYDLVKVP